MKRGRPSRENHRRIRLINIRSKLLAGIIFQRLSDTRERRTCISQATFRFGWGRIDHIITLRRIVEHGHFL